MYRFFILFLFCFLLIGCNSEAEPHDDNSNNLVTAENDTASDKELSIHSVIYSLSFSDENGTELPYLLYLPSSVSDKAEQNHDGSYPLVLFLHGAGECGTDNKAQANDTGIIPRLTDEDFYSKHPAIILAPQCPLNEQWVDVPWTKGSYSTDETPVSNELSAVTELLERICQEYPVDRSRIYISGVSMGGYGSWDMLIRNPDLFSAGIILCGAGDPSRADAISHIPLQVFHGAKDEEVPLSGSLDMVYALKEFGSSVVHYTEYADIGHWIWLNAWEEDGLLEWLFTQRK